MDDDIEIRKGEFRIGDGSRKVGLKEALKEFDVFSKKYDTKKNKDNFYSFISGHYGRSSISDIEKNKKILEKEFPEIKKSKRPRI